MGFPKKKRLSTKELCQGYICKILLSALFLVRFLGPRGLSELVADCVSDVSMPHCRLPLGRRPSQGLLPLETNQPALTLDPVVCELNAFISNCLLSPHLLPF